MLEGTVAACDKCNIALSVCFVQLCCSLWRLIFVFLLLLFFRLRVSLPLLVGAVVVGCVCVVFV